MCCGCFYYSSVNVWRGWWRWLQLLSRYRVTSGRAPGCVITSSRGTLGPETFPMISLCESLQNDSFDPPKSIKGAAGLSKFLGLLQSLWCTNFPHWAAVKASSEVTELWSTTTTLLFSSTDEALTERHCRVIGSGSLVVVSMICDITDYNLRGLAFLSVSLSSRDVPAPPCCVLPMRVKSWWRSGTINAPPAPDWTRSLDSLHSGLNR